MSRVSRGFRIAGKTVKAVFYLLVFSLIFFLLWRIFSSDNPKSMEGLTLNDKVYAAYEQEGSDLYMFRQNLDMITRAEHNSGYFAITDSIFIPSANQIQLTFRYNNSTISSLVEDKGLSEIPSRDVELFDVTLLFAIDLTPENKDDANNPDTVKLVRVHANSSTPDKKNLYNFRRFVFDLGDLDLKQIVEDGTLISVFTDIYYAGDADYEKTPYGTLCLYDYITETYDVKLSSADKKAIEDWKSKK
jgi:hypothetical protein